MSIDAVRSVADAVLYEGYLLYPYRASAAKNRSRWQFGVLGPPDAAATAFAEAPDMATQCLLTPAAAGTVRIWLRFLHLQVRQVQRIGADGSYVDADEVVAGGASILSWDEAVEREIALPPRSLTGAADVPVTIPGGIETEPIAAGRIVRRRWPLTARVRTRVEPGDGYLRLTVEVANEHPARVADKETAIRSSLIGAHLLIQAEGTSFVSVLDPPAEAAAAAARCTQRRCWPVLAGPAGSADVVLAAPIILYDHPRIAEQSPGALYDSTEIDEILTLRVMTLTEAEKAEARATDPRAREIIDRCDDLSPAAMQQLHGVLRDGTPWWDPAADSSVHPDTDAVVIGGVRVAKGSLVRVHPSRRADAQDLFFAGQVARVTAVFADVDGGEHVAVVLVDDPAADLHDWYGRYFYFAPDEIEPLPAVAREEYRS
ncbi:MAG TPA: hypothetical protein VFR35_19805 [Actinoplanes sp.]|nr:hypothetical protein [Actinoplanes sp.]